MLPADLPLDDLLAHLELLRRERGSLAVITGTGMELVAFAVGLDPARRRVVVNIPDLPPRVLGVGDAVRLALPLGGQRWEGPSRIELQPSRTQFALRLPGAISRHDRRHAPRIAVSPDSGLRALVQLSSQGPTLTGPLINLSAGGFRFQVERAMDLEGHVRLDPKALGLEPGHPLHGVELTGLRADPLEAAGMLREVDEGPRGLCLNVQFRGLLRADRSELQAWAEARWTEPGLPERPTLSVMATPEPLLLFMPTSPARDALLALLEQAGQTPVRVVEELADLRTLAQLGALRGAVLAAEPALNRSACGILRTLRGSRPWRLLALAPAPEGALELATPLRSADLLKALGNA